MDNLATEMLKELKTNAKRWFIAFIVVLVLWFTTIFNDTQQEIFNRLTDKRGRQSIVQISMEMNLSTATVSRVIKQIKHKILKII